MGNDRYLAQPDFPIRSELLLPLHCSLSSPRKNEEIEEIQISLNLFTLPF
jgi:hypothetical protein